MKKENSKVVIYQAKNGAIELKGDYTKDTIWASQAQIAEVFGVNPQAITKHVANIYKEAELTKAATCSIMEQVRVEGGRQVKRKIEMYNLDLIISVGCRVNSKKATEFRQWANKVLKGYITDGIVVNKKVALKHQEKFRQILNDLGAVLPISEGVDYKSVFDLINNYADVWLSLDAYDKDQLSTKGASKKSVEITAEDLMSSIKALKLELIKKNQATELFASERSHGALEGVIGNVMQSFGGKDVYESVESKAAHLLYFVVKNHIFSDGNKRSGAFSFIWFLRKFASKSLQKINPAALTALTILVAESNPKDKDRVTALIISLI